MLTFSLITPTIQRQSLVRCCSSIDSQTYPHWQHVVALDCPPEEINLGLMDQIQHPKREIFCCERKFGNYGNHARWMAWEKVTGDYIVMLDCDNFVADNKILEDMATVLQGNPDWAIFPIARHGRWFFNDPPGLCMSDTLNIVVKREIGRWPDIEAREADGHWVEALKLSHPNYAVFPHFRPIGVMEHSSNGV